MRLIRQLLYMNAPASEPNACKTLALDFSYRPDAQRPVPGPVASRLKYVVGSDSKVYLRNLNKFDSTVPSCCYNYWIDLTTPAGQAQWATLLVKIEEQRGEWIFCVEPDCYGSWRSRRFAGWLKGAPGRH